MLNLFINRPMVCGLRGTASTYVLLTVFIFVYILNTNSRAAAFLVNSCFLC